MRALRELLSMLPAKEDKLLELMLLKGHGRGDADGKHWLIITTLTSREPAQQGCLKETEHQRVNGAAQ